MNKGIIYLIQPSELVGTSRYKIGMSNNPDLERCKNGYKKGSRYLCIMECHNPIILEKNIKNEFNKKFKLISGNEFYEGNEKELLNTFNDLVMDYNNIFIIDNKNDNTYDKDLEETDIDNLIEIKKEFINYKEDIEFGGIKQLIKVYIKEYYIKDNIKRDDYIINFKYICNKQIEEDNLYIDNINDYSYNYIKKIIDNNIIQNDHTYDLNDVFFQKNINKLKKIYNNVIFSEKTNDRLINIKYLEKNTITYLFEIDCLINNIPCISYYNKNSFSFYPFSHLNEFKIYKINDKYYDKLYLYEYVPYCIEIFNNSYYILNRNYEYIGLGVKHINNYNGIREYLLTDFEHIFTNDKNNINNYIKKLIKKYKELTQYKKCLNSNKNTDSILSIF